MSRHIKREKGLHLLNVRRSKCRCLNCLICSNRITIMLQYDKHKTAIFMISSLDCYKQCGMNHLSQEVSDNVVELEIMQAMFFRRGLKMLTGLLWLCLVQAPVYRNPILLAKFLQNATSQKKCWTVNPCRIMFDSFASLFSSKSCRHLYADTSLTLLKNYQQKAKVY